MMKSPFVTYAVTYYFLTTLLNDVIVVSAMYAAVPSLPSNLKPTTTHLRPPVLAFSTYTGVFVRSGLNSRFCSNSNTSAQLKIHRSSTLLPSQPKEKEDTDDDRMTTVGSSDYYKGFINRSVNEEPLERVTGDNLLGPIMKFSGITALALVVLTVAFFVSNGLI